jgi:hypothetical protein
MSTRIDTGIMFCLLRAWMLLVLLFQRYNQSFHFFGLCGKPERIRIDYDHYSRDTPKERYNEDTGETNIRAKRRYNQGSESRRGKPLNTFNERDKTTRNRHRAI